jgi:hypothetical protein
LQAVALAQVNPPAQAVAVPAVHVPEPLQALTVSMPLAQLEPHWVVEVGYTQAPVPIAQPVAPQVPPPVQAALQQLPEPLVPQAPDVHSLSPPLVPQGRPAGFVSQVEPLQ